MSTSEIKKPRPRINRSVSFPVAIHKWIAAEAKKQNRSFNFIVNQCIERQSRRIS